MNYVAKRYMEDVDRDVYFEDVRLQMDAKLWGDEYNRHNPPKKVRATSNKQTSMQRIAIWTQCSAATHTVFVFLHILFLSTSVRSHE